MAILDDQKFDNTAFFMICDSKMSHEFSKYGTQNFSTDSEEKNM